MQRMTEEEVKNERLNILKYIKTICEANKIAYSLTGGTLLGAVRHKGYIPWDDDIDVFLTRPEYQKFEKVMEDQDEYLWLTRNHDPKYHFNFGRVVSRQTIIKDDGLPDIDGYGVFVDVCVVDGLPGNKLKRDLHILHIRWLYRCRRSASYSNKEYVPRNPLKRVFKKTLQMYTKRVGISEWVNRLEKYVSKYPFNESDFVGNVMSQYGYREVLSRSSFDKYIEMSFEGEKFSVLTGWEEYLKNIYGDYMKLPPAEEREGHHLGIAYWRNK